MWIRLSYFEFEIEWNGMEYVNGFPLTKNPNTRANRLNIIVVLLFSYPVYSFGIKDNFAVMGNIGRSIGPINWVLVKFVWVPNSGPRNQTDKLQKELGNNFLPVPSRRQIALISTNEFYFIKALKTFKMFALSIQPVWWPFCIRVRLNNEILSSSLFNDKIFKAAIQPFTLWILGKINSPSRYILSWR